MLNLWLTSDVLPFPGHPEDLSSRLEERWRGSVWNVSDLPVPWKHRWKVGSGRDQQRKHGTERAKLRRKMSNRVKAEYQRLRRDPDRCRSTGVWTIDFAEITKRMCSNSSHVPRWVEQLLEEIFEAWLSSKKEGVDAFVANKPIRRVFDSISDLGEIENEGAVEATFLVKWKKISAKQYACNNSGTRERGRASGDRLLPRWNPINRDEISLRPCRPSALGVRSTKQAVTRAAEN